ncbi:hypothetical protein E1J29_08750 [Xanthomonas hortorum pv. vitians]|nr:hypothetical protein [Xanthomonas hortorum pv. vitians]QEW16181.1 hypothetical protein DYQ48_15645 [Xanthomonas hortorum]NMI25900.1 hypothetical protein [Xanthomonas hortorum pv. vitians]NMI30369.1 hypothetical protein [Xanthomonas hortorum pv. vitians]NMI34547.1 hypothetical protein [Xanthomonas hortorum pv. vitians]
MNGIGIDVCKAMLDVAVHCGPFARFHNTPAGHRKLLQGRTCGVSRDGGRARALQTSRRSAALQMDGPSMR